MRGVVVAINLTRGMAAISTEENHTIVDLMGVEIDVGDRVNWTAHRPLGDGILLNETKGIRSRVFFENHWVSRESLIPQLRLVNGNSLSRAKNYRDVFG